MGISTFLTALASLAGIDIVVGHTLFTNLIINDIDQGAGTCVRMPKNPSTATNPINNLAGKEMACGFDGTQGVLRVCPVPQSSILGFLFRTWPDASQPGSIDISHKGPCAVYMKSVVSAKSDPGTGRGWFKIFDSGYDFNTNEWCTEILIKNNGILTVNIPADLAGGYYLVRPELLSLHQADKNPPNPQFYTGCAQIFLDSAATAVVKETVSIPGHVSIEDPAVLFNIYEPKFPAPRVGPEPYTSNSATGKPKVLDQKPMQSEGLLPENAVVTNANWWGVEVDPYSTENGCWKASQNCSDQLHVCYETAPSTGSVGCKLWESRCTTIRNECSEGRFHGPPNKGALLNIKAESHASVSIATVLNALLTTSTSGPTASSISASAAIPIPSNLRISTSARCGSIVNLTCKGALKFGECCSQAGWCGSDFHYCGKGCQIGYGVCSSDSGNTDGRMSENLKYHGRKM